MDLEAQEVLASSALLLDSAAAAVDQDLTTTTLDSETVEALPEAEALAVQVEAADLVQVDQVVQEDLPEVVDLAVRVEAVVAADLAQVDLQDQEDLRAAVARIPAEVTAAAVDNGLTMELVNTTIRLAPTDLDLLDTCTKLDPMAE